MGQPRSTSDSLMVVFWNAIRKDCRGASSGVDGIHTVELSATLTVVVVPMVGVELGVAVLLLGTLLGAVVLVLGAKLGTVSLSPIDPFKEAPAV